MENLVLHFPALRFAPPLKVLISSLVIWAVFFQVLRMTGPAFSVHPTKPDEFMNEINWALYSPSTSMCQTHLRHKRTDGQRD